ncbi:hypothetical protein [Mitsuaria sp. 7]|uniref:hypothetical protein n=1 Tax=Mitsuaria sp. 7 TaxID=1658665 RepID=UPI0007DCE669|nr:hypothetical protein [Mitsuaria sp. 7]ANH66712.1 hypothetical protein ABE85_02465 [Mitsuaria sp. 7]
MTLRRHHFLRLAAAAAAVILAGCTMTHATGRKNDDREPAARKLAVVFVAGHFGGANLATIKGEGDTTALLPHLAERIPLVFQNNGVPTRTLGYVETPEQVFERYTLQPGEQFLVLAPNRATVWNGKTLSFKAQTLIEPQPKGPTWTGEVKLIAHTFVTFDAKTADGFALKLLEQLRTDKVARVKAGPLNAP